MSLLDKIKDKITGRRNIESNEINNELKYAVEQKPKINLDKYNPFPTPEQLAKQRSGTIEEEIKKEVGENNIPPFQPLNMPMKNQFSNQENKNLDEGENINFNRIRESGMGKGQDINDRMDLIMEEMESIRSQNEMILHRLKNIERILNAHQ